MSDSAPADVLTETLLIDDGPDADEASIDDSETDADETATIDSTADTPTEETDAGTEGGSDVAPDVVVADTGADAGHEAGVCTPGSKDCNGPVSRVCDSTGNWGVLTPCPYVCSGAGNCTRQLPTRFETVLRYDVRDLRHDGYLADDIDLSLRLYWSWRVLGLVRADDATVQRHGFADVRFDGNVGDHVDVSLHL